MLRVCLSVCTLVDLSVWLFMMHFCLSVSLSFLLFTCQCEKINKLGVFGDERANHVLVNEYLPGQGIMVSMSFEQLLTTISTSIFDTFTAHDCIINTFTVHESIVSTDVDDFFKKYRLFF